VKILPEEPIAGQHVTSLMIRLLDGQRIQRRFLKTDTLSMVFAFVESKFPIQLLEESAKYDLVSNFPRKTFNQLEHANLTLQETGLIPQASLFVSERTQ